MSSSALITLETRTELVAVIQQRIETARQLGVTSTRMLRGVGEVTVMRGTIEGNKYGPALDYPKPSLPGNYALTTATLIEWTRSEEKIASIVLPLASNSIKEIPLSSPSEHDIEIALQNNPDVTSSDRFLRALVEGLELSELAARFAAARIVDRPSDYGLWAV